MDECINVDAAETEELLKQAISERARLIVVPAPLQGSPKSVSGMIVSLNNNNIVLEITSLGGLTMASWLQSEVTCYVQLLDRTRACEFYYNFTSPVLSLSKHPGGYACVLLMPSALALGQRRLSMRIYPRTDYISGLSLWQDDRFMIRCAETNKVRLLPPMITNDHLQERQVQIMDISAGGMKLKILHPALKEVIQIWESITGLVIWLVLFDPKQDRNDTLWFKSRICHTQTDHVTKDITTCLVLTDEGVKAEGGKLSWRKVERHMVKELAAWTYERYLESSAKGMR